MLDHQKENQSLVSIEVIQLLRTEEALVSQPQHLVLLTPRRTLEEVYQGGHNTESQIQLVKWEVVVSQTFQCQVVNL